MGLFLWMEETRKRWDLWKILSRKEEEQVYGASLKGSDEKERKIAFKPTPYQSSRYNQPSAWALWCP